MSPEAKLLATHNFLSAGKLFGFGQDTQPNQSSKAACFTRFDVPPCVAAVFDLKRKVS